MDLIDDGAPAGPGGLGGNAHEYTVSELSGAVKRVIEGEFGRVRVRGEIGRLSRPASGHLYFALKDDRAVLDAVAWKGQAARLSVRPEEGIEVIATGRMTTFPGSSKYQLVVEELELAGAGALMAMLEKRKAALAAEGLFAEALKKPLPFLPDVIGVVTSPSGAVIRDILHRLRDRFPRRVLIWPVAVQGERCAAEVAAAIRGFNALAPDGPIPRPDLLIVARGGGSLEDLWGFNEEIVVRAAAASEIPLISAVGHETDTTLIDYAADRRAPTPTAAAEMAVPVRADLLAWTAEQDARLQRAAGRATSDRRQRLRDLARALPRPEALVGIPRQRLDLWADRLPAALRTRIDRARLRLANAPVRPETLQRSLAERRDRLARADRRDAALDRRLRDVRHELDRVGPKLVPAPLQVRISRQREDLAALWARAERAQRVRSARASEALAGLSRLLGSLDYHATLERGFAVVRDGAGLVTTRAQAGAAAALEIEFRDGAIAVTPIAGASRTSRTAKPAKPPEEQGSLF